MHWSPRPAETAALAAIGAALLVALAFLDAAGRLLAGAAALFVAGLVARDFLLRPRLSAGPDGVAVRTAGGRKVLPWPGLRIRVRESRRLGLRRRTLELDTAAGPDDEGLLVVLGRRDLGADPDDVARALWGLDPMSR